MGGILAGVGGRREWRVGSWGVDAGGVNGGKGKWRDVRGGGSGIRTGAFCGGVVGGASRGNPGESLTSWEKNTRPKDAVQKGFFISWIKIPWYF